MVSVANTAKKIRQEIADQIGVIGNSAEEGSRESLIWDGHTEDGVIEADLAICGPYEDGIEGWQNEDWHWLIDTAAALGCSIGEANGTPALFEAEVEFEGLGIAFGQATTEQKEAMTRALMAVCVTRWGGIVAIHGTRDALETADAIMSGDAGDILVEVAMNDRNSVNPAQFHQWSMTV